MKSFPVQYEHLFTLHQTVEKKPVRYQCNQPRSQGSLSCFEKARGRTLGTRLICNHPLSRQARRCFATSQNRAENTVFMREQKAFPMWFSCRCKNHPVQRRHSPKIVYVRNLYLKYNLFLSASIHNKNEIIKIQRECIYISS